MVSLNLLDKNVISVHKIRQLRDKCKYFFKNEDLILSGDKILAKIYVEGKHSFLRFGR